MTYIFHAFEVNLGPAGTRLKKGIHLNDVSGNTDVTSERTLHKICVFRVMSSGSPRDTWS